MNVALACAAAFQAVHIQNARQPGSIRSVGLPGLGANTGKVPVEICADLMWSGYNVFRRRAFVDFAEMRAALEAELGDLGPTSSSGKVWTEIAANLDETLQEDEEGVPSEPAKQKDEEVDFDDF